MLARSHISIRSWTISIPRFLYSPWAHCAANPLNFIDPDGKDYHCIDNKGYIYLAIENDDDFDVILGCSDNMRVEKGFLNTFISAEESKIRLDIYSTNSEDAEKYFEFFANNTDVEWSILYSDTGSKYIGTTHLEDSDATAGYMINNNESIIESIYRFDHSHSTESGCSSADRFVASKFPYEGQFVSNFCNTIFSVDGILDGIHQALFIDVADTSEKLWFPGDLNELVPLYMFDNNIAGNFTKRFCATIDTLDDFNQALFIDIADPSEKLWFPGDLNEYLYIYCSNLQKLDNVAGAMFTERERPILILDDRPEWLENMPFHATGDSIIIEFSTRHDKYNYYMLYENDYVSALRVTKDGKVNPMTLRNNLASIQKLNVHKRFEWIEPFYRTNGLTNGCGYYDQIDLSKVVYKR